MIRTIGWIVSGALLLAPLAAAVVGVVSVFIHPRRTPRSPGESVLWACRGVAYSTAALLGAWIGVTAAVGTLRPSTFAAVIIAFALVGIRMRHEHHGTGRGKDAT